MRDHVFRITLGTKLVVFILNDCNTEKMKTIRSDTTFQNQYASEVYI